MRKNIGIVTITVFFCIVTCLAIFCMHKNYKGTDYWEHRAAIKELAYNSNDPTHPLYLEHVAHPFFSPYSYVVASFSKLTGASVEMSMHIFGVMNILCIFVFMHMFVKNYSTSNTTAALSLFLMLFLWPNGTMAWSGFFHLNAITQNSEYPSTLCFALSLLFGRIYHLSLTKNNHILNAIAIPIATFIMLSHAPTYVFLLTIMTASTIYALRNSRDRILILASYTASILIPAMIGALWKYYSIFTLVTAGNETFNDQSAIFYKHAPIVATMAVALTVGAYKSIKDKKAYLATIVAMNSAIYLLGYITGMYGLGRSLSFTAIAIQLYIADALSPPRPRISATPAMLFVAICAMNYTTIVGIISINTNSENFYSSYSIIDDHVKPYDVVLSDPLTSWAIPAHSGRIISSIHPIYFINNEERKNDLLESINCSSENVTLESILSKYSVKYILINYNTMTCADRFRHLGHTVGKKGTFELIQIDHTESIDTANTGE